ncbi:MAG: PspC domain-containing protein [Pseudomonadota bacterium]
MTQEDQSRRNRRSSSADLQRAISQLEDAVQDVVRSTTDDLAGRATAMLDETTRRLRGAADDGGQRGAGWGERVGRKLDELKPKARKLQRDPHNKRIAGVCAGFANYFGVESWVARLVAVSMFIFMPQITFPAYIVAWVLMERGGRERDGWIARQRGDHRSPAPEFGPRLSPRRSLRQVHADLTDAELKLRRLETHVTSDQYALRRELAALDGARP